MPSITENKQGMKVLITGNILQLFLGIIYIWSVFMNPVSAFYGIIGGLSVGAALIIILKLMNLKQVKETD